MANNEEFKGALRFRFNEKKATQAAAHLLKLNNGKMNHMVLIKLLYLADRRALLEHGQPITGDAMVSMVNGPVLSQVLNLINDGVSRGGYNWVQYVGERDHNEVALKVECPDNDEMSRYELRVLEETFARFGKMDRWDLVKWCHDNLPEWKDPEGSALPIAFIDVLRENGCSEERIQSIREDAEVAWSIGGLG